MSRKNILLGLAIVLIAITFLATWIMASGEDTRVAAAAMKGDKEIVRQLLKQAADVNAAQGDGMTALHWAALNGDAELAQTLLYAGANVRATTRIGAYTPLFMAAKSGSPAVIDLLLKNGADPKAKGVDGLTPLMMASMAGNRASVRLLLEHGADANAKEAENGQTPMIFAAAFNRPEVIAELVKHGGDVNQATPVRTPPPAPTRNFQLQAQQPQQQQQQQPAVQPKPEGEKKPGPAVGNAATPQPAAQPPLLGNEPPSRGGGNPKGALTPLMYAAREGSLEATKALVEAGAKLNEQSADKSTALLLAVINGKFDLAKYLVEQNADVNLLSVDGAGPLYAVVHTQWSRESFHPQPSIKLEKTHYLDLMRIMLEHGAAPNARLTKVLWYSSYGYAYEAASEIGTTPFWRCAAVADLDGMKLLVSRGADPNIANKEGVNAFLIASGAGTHGNDEVNAPAGRMAAVRYLVEDLHFDVNAADTGSTFRGEFAFQQRGQSQGQQQGQGQGQPQPQQPQQQQQQRNPFGGMAAGGFTALHNAASRGDNEMILYLVSKGAKVNAVSASGMTVVDMANGPRQRVQPFPETIALLEMLGAKNSHRCVSC